MNIDRTAFILKQLFGSFPHSKIQAEGVATYIRLLQDIPIDDLQSIVDQCITECKFLPTIAEIRDRWHDLTRDPSALTANEAWGEVVKAFQQVGWMAIPEFSDARIAKIVKAMGWRTLCESENQMADRAHFMKFFDSITERDEKYAKLLPASRDLLERSRRERNETLPGTGIRFLVNGEDL